MAIPGTNGHSEVSLVGGEDVEGVVAFRQHDVGSVGDSETGEVFLVPEQSVCPRKVFFLEGFQPVCAAVHFREKRYLCLPSVVA